MPVYSKILNDLFINKLNKDREFASSISSKFVSERNPKVEDVEVNVRQVANLVTIEVSGMSEGEQRSGERIWTKEEILATPDPVTKLIDDLAKEVFEVPSEGAPVS